MKEFHINGSEVPLIVLKIILNLIVILIVNQNIINIWLTAVLE